ncbi:MAG: SlyX family protein [Xanthomonadales bacterium]|nr:SlyX family protein [Xanthomonadales bacterium]
MTASDAQRLDELESRLAFQDDLIENLNEVVVRHDRELGRLARRLRELENRLQAVADLAADAGADSGHEVPPHY